MALNCKCRMRRDSQRQSACPKKKSKLANHSKIGLSQNCQNLVAAVLKLPKSISNSQQNILFLLLTWHNGAAKLSPSSPTNIANIRLPSHPYPATKISHWNIWTTRPTWRTASLKLSICNTVQNKWTTLSKSAKQKSLSS